VKDDALPLTAATGAPSTPLKTQVWMALSADAAALGDGTNTSSARAKVVPGVANASAVTAADVHACAIIAGEAYCWGANGDANLGDGTLLSRTSPRLVAVEACE
jgi:hypothetical protein